MIGDIIFFTSVHSFSPEQASLIHAYNMACVYRFQLIFLSQVWCMLRVSADATLQVVATCNEDVLLPCESFQDLKVTDMVVSWYKTGENGEAWEHLQQNREQNYSRKLNEFIEVSNGSWHFLKFENISDHSSGTYKCVLSTPAGEYNQSSRIILKVKDCPEQSEHGKLKKYETELVMLLLLGFFYLLLIFFTCTCLKEKTSPDHHKSWEQHKPCLSSTC
uniref:CD83 molecule n=1 Tax=Salvator merianae TaxID=96440 RepID=A0A8D0B966_SALMN